jgi:hypothetical protein
MNERTVSSAAGELCLACAHGGYFTVLEEEPASPAASLFRANCQPLSTRQNP